MPEYIPLLSSMSRAGQGSEGTSVGKADGEFDGCLVGIFDGCNVSYLNVGAGDGPDVGDTLGEKLPEQFILMGTPRSSENSCCRSQVVSHEGYGPLSSNEVTQYSASSSDLIDQKLPPSCVL